MKETRIIQPDDYSGRVVCTVVSSPAAESRDVAVLYVHGFSDYYFNEDMAEEFNRHGYDFYAVDLRKYGRSLLPGQRMFEVRDLIEYFPDIEAALGLIRGDGHQEVVLMGHSTGGLICSLFMARWPHPQVGALILNSPFLAWNLSWFKRRVAIPLICLIARVAPRLVIPQAKDPAYARTLHRVFGGEWDYDRRLKPDVLPDVDAGWIAAIEKAQRRLRLGADIAVPVLLLHSDASARKGDPADKFSHADAILDVESLAAVGRGLGHDVTEVTVDGGLHDILLSKKPVREKAYRVIFEWLAKKI